MNLVDLKIIEFVNEVDSASPAPGGGSVAALAGTLGASLVRMVGHLTVTKKKFLALSESEQSDFNNDIKYLLTIKERLITLIDADTESFKKIMAAFQMPKISDKEIELRNQAIQIATLGAIEVPLEVASLCCNALQRLERILCNGNKNALSDLGVGTLMLYSGMEGAILNVKINLSGITDTKKVSYFQEKSQQYLTNGTEVKDKILAAIHARLV
ncbi:MAG: cyclodeaminase/cyclohydrolase family protein [Candidatus Izemoplasmatales bacterium]|jgi:formiminotetrahydrofolate cyclodeaminase|nr:cyclodeaminase/cyclohydrolase family protein [Candidatus Izemoplasmatales bacterium]MDD3865038.1 cyclodeaminase/cyclohydrolase family protein [Candidatus Izemoplasmatales bacterium]